MSMEARLFRLFAATVPALLLWGATSSPGATFSTRNFVVNALDPAFAQEVAQTAERFRAHLAREWLGHELPTWYRPCQISVQVGQIGAGGATTFTFAAGEVFDWHMRVQGTAERILDSVIPHEVSHTIFASHFRRPLPRWADEGAASLVEHESEQLRQIHLLRQVFSTPQRIPLTKLISMKEYPSDMQSVLTLYAEGYSLADYLVRSGGETGRARYLSFLQDAYEHNWNYAISTHYGLRDVASLERRWTDWVLAGGSDIPASDKEQIAQADARALRKRGILVRSQSPDDTNPQLSPRKTAQAARPADAIPRDDELEAPNPVRRAVRKDRGGGGGGGGGNARNRVNSARDADEAFAPESVRQDEMRDAAPATPRDSASSTLLVSRANSSGRATANESPVRKRFRNAKERRDAESAAGLSDNDDPFESRRGVPSQTDIDRSESPFHTEN